MSKRTCIITGETTEPFNLLRFVISPDGILTPDVAYKLTGRGAYIMPRPEYVREALKKYKFAKHLNFQKKLLPKEIDLFICSLENLLQKHFIQQIGLFRKRGRAIAGATKLKEKTLLAGLLIASDASVKEARNIEFVTDPNWVLREIPSEILGRAFGRNSLAFAGILNLKYKKSIFDEHSLKHSFRRWNSFINVNSCQKGTDGCINEHAELLNESKVSKKG